jgi:hypothetical protein
VVNTLTYFPVTGDYRNVADPVISGTTNVPDLEIIEGFVTFFPRLPKGFVAYVNDFQIAVDQNQISTITLINASGGTFKLQYLTGWTTNIAWNAAASAVQSALAALPGIGSGNVAVSGSAGGPWTVTFQGALANQLLSGLTGDGSLLTGSFPQVQTPTTTPGSTAASKDTALAIPPRKGRIWNGTLSTIDVSDTPGVELVANSPALALQDQGITSLVYDVQYSSVTFDGSSQVLNNFAFVAPVDNTAICITDPALHRLDYQGPP